MDHQRHVGDPHPRPAPGPERRGKGRTVWLLFCCQALMSAVALGHAATGALIAHSLATNKALATLPAGISMAAAMAASVVAAATFERFGRRTGFLLGAGASTAGCLIFAAAIWRGDFALQCVGAVPAGLGFGIAQHLRFAAAEVAEPSSRPRAVALVMAGGVLAAAVAPSAVLHTKDLAGPFLFLGTYLCLAVLPLAAVALLACADLPPPSGRREGTRPTPIREIVRRPDFVAAAVAGMAAYASMNLVMVSMPVQMTLCGFGVDDGAAVLGVHGVAMFGPGFVTGRLERFADQVER
jgi:predicted MFS family arabinose efflux permease